jgi:hypothetical protein
LAILLLAQSGNAQQASPAVDIVQAPAQAAAQADGLQPSAPACPCATCDPCCCPGWYAFGDFLYLRPRDAGVEYAVPINGPIAAGQVPLQVGRTAMTNPEFAAGFRLGIGKDLDNCSSISAEYTYYRNVANDAINIGASPFELRSMVFHPSSPDAAADWLSASAHQTIGFDLADIDFHRDLISNDCCSLGYLVGVRYADLKQQFHADFENIISEDVDTGVNFDGAGLRVGLEGQSRWAKGIFFYGKTDASFLGGEFRAHYLQSSINDPVIAETTWKEARFITMLDGEVGTGWASQGGRFRVSLGYMITSWLNVVKPSDFIASVQANQYTGPNKMGQTALTFDGLVARAEVTW